MPVTRITTKVQLPASSLIDVLLVQWHTPTPEMGGVMNRAHYQRRRQALQRITTWLQEGYECTEEDRPLFILFPEISIPRTLVGHVDALIEATNRPTVAIGGLEYMTKTDFEEFGASLNLVVPLDEVLEQLKGGDIVNAAGVWMREPDGPVRHFLQPKNHPFEPEAPQLCCGKLLGLFTSADQGKGRRLNFTAHVCADFAAADRVRQMLTACEQEMTNAHLDVAFVIQHQADQAAEQFLDAAAAYFAPPTGGDTWADTAGASIVMINNAAERTHRRGEWGDSQFKYQFMYGAKRKQLGGTDTYFLVDDGAHDTQAGVMRAAGPSAYLVHYKPRSLVRQVRGQEWPEPFMDGSCLHAPLDHVEGELQFEPLRAVPFWLKCEWTEAAGSFQGDLKELAEAGSVPDRMIDWWEHQLGSAVNGWLTKLHATPSVGIDLVAKCLLLQRDIDDCPPKQREPEEWGQVVSLAMREFLRVFVLSLAGESNGRRMSPAPQGLRHAVSPTGAWVSFVWGQGARTVQIVRAYLGAMEEDPGIVASQDIVVVMMGPTRDQPSQAQIDEAFDIWSSIHRQGVPDGSLDRVGEVAAPTLPRPRFIHSPPLENALRADSPEAAADLASHLGAAK